MNRRLSFGTQRFGLDPEIDQSSEPLKDEFEDSEFELEADGYTELGESEDSVQYEFAEEAMDSEDFEDLEEREDLEDVEFEGAKLSPAAIKGATTSQACEVLDGFDFDNDALKPQHQKQLDAVARRLIASQNSAQPIRSVKIIGHTDPVGNAKYNIDLGSRRAKQIANALRRTLDRLRAGSSARITLSPESRGEAEPLGLGPAKDRRVQICFPPTARPKGCAPHKSRIRLHLKILVQPTRFSIATMLQSMRQVYGPAGFLVVVASRETLRLPSLEELDVSCPNASQPCRRCPPPNTNLNAEHVTLFQHRNRVRPNDVVVYFVRRTVPSLNGTAAHPAGRPGVVITARASQWSLAHEVGHVLQLCHVNNRDRLMTGGGTNKITNPPPDLIAAEIQTMERSALTVPC